MTELNWWLVMLSIFSYAFKPSVYPLEKCLFRFFAHFLIRVFFDVDILWVFFYILGINFLPDLLFATHATRLMWVDVKEHTIHVVL